MMKKKHPIEELIEQGEHQQLDFKFEVSDSKKIARTLSAFANTDGGRLLIGVKDNGNIAGIISEEEYYMIEAASKMYTQPIVPFTARRWEVGGKTVLEVYIEKGDEPPYCAPDKDDKFKAYIRVADENMLANDILVKAWRKRGNQEGTLLKLTGAIEQLFTFLENNPTITMRTFCKIAKINYYSAKNILIDLLALGTLQYTIEDKHIVYKKNPGNT